jgi:SAM-dependent methyltransferase
MSNRAAAAPKTMQLRSGGRCHGFSGFTDVDSYSNPQLLVNYLERKNSHKFVQQSKEQLIQQLRPQKGETILEIGCGLGLDTCKLASLVGPSGLVVGIDKSSTMMREAKKNTRRFHHNVSLLLEDVHKLHLPDNTFDGCMAASTFLHLRNPLRALSEISRVLKSGGRIALLEPDWDTVVITAGPPHVGRTVRRILRHSVRHSGIAHQLPILFRRIGLDILNIQAGTLLLHDFDFANVVWRLNDNIARARETGLISSICSKTISQQLKMASRKGEFFAAATGIGILGYKSKTINSLKCGS